MIEKKNSEGMTPLICAALRGDIDTVRRLLANRANVKARDKFERTPLIAAAATHRGPLACSVEIARLLLDHGADVDPQNRSGLTALREVATQHNLPMVELLLVDGADPMLKDKRGMTILEYSRDPQMVNLIEKARVNK